MSFENLLKIIDSNKNNSEAKITRNAAFLAIATSDEALVKTESGRKLVKTVFNIDIPELKEYKTLDSAEEAYESILFDLAKESNGIKALKKYSLESFEDLRNNFSNDKNLVKFLEKLENTFDFTTLNVTKTVDDMLIHYKDVNSEMAQASAFVKENVCENVSSFIKKDHEFNEFLFKLTLDVAKKSTRTAALFSNVGEVFMYGCMAQLYVFTAILANLRNIYNITDKPLSEMQLVYTHNISTRIIKDTVLETMDLIKTLNSAKNLRTIAEFNLCKIAESVTTGQFETEDTDDSNLSDFLKRLASEFKTVDLDNGKSVTIGKIEITGKNKNQLKQQLQDIVDKL